MKTIINQHYSLWFYHGDIPRNKPNTATGHGHPNRGFADYQQFSTQLRKLLAEKVGWPGPWHRHWSRPYCFCDLFVWMCICCIFRMCFRISVVWLFVLTLLKVREVILEWKSASCQYLPIAINKSTSIIWLISHGRSTVLQSRISIWSNPNY